MSARPDGAGARWTVNPEFLRNLWLEITVNRVVAMPLLVALTYLAVGQGFQRGDQALPGLCYAGTALLLVVWGSRMAADTLLNEIAARTWDQQRMSRLGAFEMTWGKLLGGTAFVWYGAFWVVAIGLLFGQADPGRVGRILMTGLFVQTATMFVALLIYRLDPAGGRTQVPMAQSLGVIIGVPYLALAGAVEEFGKWLARVGLDPVSFRFYGITFDPVAFLFWSQAFFTFWAAVGIYRLVWVELQFRTVPWLWLAFVASAGIYIAGWDISVIRTGIATIAGTELLVRVFAAFLLTVGGVYLAAFFEPKGMVRLRRWLFLLRDRRWLRALGSTPPWVVSALVALALGAATALLWLWSVGLNPAFRDLGDLSGLTLISLPLIVAVLAFAARDVGMLYLLTLDGAARRGLMACLVWLAFAHVLLPLLISWLGGAHLLPLVLPRHDGPALLVMLPGLLQAALVWWLVRWRWRRLAARLFSSTVRGEGRP